MEWSPASGLVSSRAEVATPSVRYDSDGDGVTEKSPKARWPWTAPKEFASGTVSLIAKTIKNFRKF